MAGIQADKGDFAHKVVSGEPIAVGLRVFTNEYKEGTVTRLAEHGLDEKCGWYCPAWHTITYDDGRTTSMNCDRLSTRLPKGF